MKMLIGIVVGIVVIIALVLIFSPRAPEDVQQASITDSPEGSMNAENGAMVGDGDQSMIAITSFGFVGYGPGKSHTGTFNSYEITNVAVNEAGLPTSGTITFAVDSLSTDTEMLTTHLTEKKEFFDSATYPTIAFTLADITDAGAGTFQVNGDLTIKGVTKRIGFVVQGQADKTFSSEFRVDMTQFGFAAPGIVDNEVLIKFSGNLF